MDNNEQNPNVENGLGNIDMSENIVDEAVVEPELLVPSPVEIKPVAPGPEVDLVEPGDGQGVQEGQEEPIPAGEVEEVATVETPEEAVKEDGTNSEAASEAVAEASEGKEEASSEAEEETTDEETVEEEVAEEEEPEEEIPPPLPDFKILENKRIVITRTRAKDLDSAMAVFFDTFSIHYPADLEFLNTLYTELSRNNNYDFFYTLLVKIDDWYENNEEYAELRDNVTKLYIDNLVLIGNNNIFERNERLEVIRKNTRRKIGEDEKNYITDKIVQNLSTKAVEAFEQALALDPENLPALNGAKNCYEFMDNYEKFQEVMTTIEEILMRKSSIVQDIEKEKTEKKEPDDEELSQQAFEQFEKDFTIITNLFLDERNDEFLEFYEKMHNPENPYTPLLLLKARVMARLRRFKDSDRLIALAEKENSHFPELNEAKTEIRQLKHGLYQKAATYYLERAMLKGITFGKPDFLKAKEALEKAMRFIDNDITMLDQYHTVLKYLKEDQEAFKTKGIIYSIDPNYTTSFDQELSNRMCFIASFAFENEPYNVDVFRWFRSEYLLNSEFGSRLNTLYMNISPRVVKALTPYPAAAKIAKACLFLPLVIIKKLQKHK